MARSDNLRQSRCASILVERWQPRRWVFLVVAALFGGVVPASGDATVDPSRTERICSIRMDVYVRGDGRSAQAVANYVADLAKRQPGLEVRTHDLIQDREKIAQLYAISQAAGRPKPVLPAFHACNRTYFGFKNAAETGPEIERLLTAEIYARASCSRCQQLKRFIPSLKRRWPAIRFQVHEVDDDPAARSRWQALCNQSGIRPGLPTIDFARRVIVGYQGDDITGHQFRQLIEQVSRCGNDRASRESIEPHGMIPALEPSRMSVAAGLFSPPKKSEPIFDLPDEATPSETGETTSPSELAGSDDVSGSGDGDDSIEVPFFGRLRVKELGLPLFTIAVGLVDGLNPCAMWILVFLLSVLVNIKDRKKILLIAGTFVVVSGLVYYAFMAAWLNLFLAIGILRPVQITLGLMAIGIGGINVKDFFAFQRGVSLSIPDQQKPGLYRRVRDIVDAKYLSVALGGAIVLAVIVNMVELLCTAGLPALYTQILTLQEMPAWKNYLFLALYISAYMFDDAVLVGVVVATLSNRRMQEQEGRWLKLISGVVILVLGWVMLFFPQWLSL